MLTYTVPFGFTVLLHFTKCIETLNRHLKQVLTIEVYVFESEKCMETFGFGHLWHGLQSGQVIQS